MSMCPTACVPVNKVFKQLTHYDETWYENYTAGATSLLYALILYQYNRYANFKDGNGTDANCIHISAAWW